MLGHPLLLRLLLPLLLRQLLLLLLLPLLLVRQRLWRTQIMVSSLRNSRWLCKSIAILLGRLVRQ